MHFLDQHNTIPDFGIIIGTGIPTGADNKTANNIEPEIKVALTEKAGEVEFRMVEGSDDFVQLQSLLASLVLAGKGSK